MIRLAVSLIAVLAVGCEARSQTNETQLPISTLVPRPTGPDMKANIRFAERVQDAALVITTLIDDARIDGETKDALAKAVLKVKKLCRETGAPGAFVEIKYEREIGAGLKMGGQAPTNLSKRIVGEASIIAVGSDPVGTLALSFAEKRFGSGEGPGKELVEFRKYWVWQHVDGEWDTAEIGMDVVRDARALYLDQARFSQIHGEAYRQALSHAIDVAERDLRAQSGHDEATALRSERIKAFNALRDIDEELRDELRKAKKANATADILAISAALLGVASSYAASKESEGAKSPDDTKLSVETTQVTTPNGRVLQLIRQRVEVEGKIYISDTAVGSFLSKRGRVVYVPKRIP